MSDRWKPFVVLVTASAALALVAGPAEAVAEYHRNRGSTCINADPSEDGIEYNFQGTLTNTHASGREVVCAIKMPLYFGTGDDLSVSLYGTPNSGGTNGVSCVLYVLKTTEPSTVVASVSGTTGSTGNLALSLEADSWPSETLSASVKCFVQNDEQIFSVTEALAY